VNLENINRKKAETDLARNIKDKFGKDVISRGLER